MSASAALPLEPPNRDDQTWRPLLFFTAYRLLLAILLLSLYLSGLGPKLLGETGPHLYLGASIAYVTLTLGSMLLALLRRPDFHFQLYLILVIDIVCVVTLMFASGGVRSGLGMLLVVSLAGGSLLVAGYIAILFAAIASTTILGAELYAQLTDAFSTTAYTQAGILGATFFATAIASHLLAVRVRESERLAHQRSVTVADLAQLNENIIQNMQTGALVVDNDGRVRLTNTSARQMLDQWGPMEAARLENVCRPLADDLAAWRHDHNLSPQSFNVEDSTLEVQPRFVSLSRGAATLIFLEDLASASRQAQQLKLAALGRLTASIAHEVRNPLGAISHAGQLLAESPSLSKADLRLTEIIRSQSQRVNTIVENILQLSRRDASRPEDFDLKRWLDDFAAEYREVHPAAAAAVGNQTDVAHLAVTFDPSHLRQVTANLVENALRHGGADGGTPKVDLHAGRLQETGRVFLEVSDNGPGIPPEVAENIFDPFFTTSGEGTGLGLYIARELCELNQARLEYRNAERGGACFRILFPENPEDKES